MDTRHRMIACTMMLLALVASCELAQPTVTPAPPTYTSVPFAATTVLPTATAVPPTATPAPTVTPKPTPTPVVPLDGRGGGMIVFSSDQGGNYDIYAMNADGSGQRRLTRDLATDGMPNWSPDGKQIAFDSDRDGNLEIYVMNTDGSDPRRLTDNNAKDGGLSWSPDSTQIAFYSTRDSNAEIYVMDADGSDPRRLTDNSAGDWEPDWSPDGSQIAFVSDRDGNAEVYVMNADGSDPRRLTDHPADDWDPDWSPDGTQIAFVSDRDGNAEIYVMDVPDGTDADHAAPGGRGTNLRRLTRSGNDAEDAFPDWSPDGTQILFVSDRDGNREIYVTLAPHASADVNADGSDQRRLTNNDADDWGAHWRPIWFEPASGGYVPIFEPAECAAYVSASHEHECGYLVVPEDRSRPNGRQVRLPVVVFKSTSPNPAPDPVIYLTGGGGYNQFAAYTYYLEGGGDEILKTRDYIMYNQRGAPLTEPELTCPGDKDILWEVYGQDLSYKERNARQIAFWQGCQETLLAQGIDLNMYTSAVNAADANDLRIALGYEQANYYGTSYGTRIGLDLIRDYPEGVRSLIIDSVYPPQVSYYTEYPHNAKRAFDLLFATCASDAHCNSSYPGLETTFYRVVEELNASPRVMSQDSRKMYVDGGYFMDAIYFLMYSNRAIARAPNVIHSAGRGDLAPAKGTLGVVPNISNYNLAVFYCIQCREEVPFDSYDHARSQAANLPQPIVDLYVSSFASFHFTLCESWRVRPDDPIENEPVVSDVPTLVLAGQFDPVTPPAWGRLAAETLRNGYFYEFPGLGHGIMRSSPCGLRIGLQFIEDPTREPDASCIDHLTGPDFE